MVSKFELGYMKERSAQTTDRAMDAPPTKRNPSAIREGALWRSERLFGDVWNREKSTIFEGGTSEVIDSYGNLCVMRFYLLSTGRDSAQLTGALMPKPRLLVIKVLASILPENMHGTLVFLTFFFFFVRARANTLVL